MPNSFQHYTMVMSFFILAQNVIAIKDIKITIKNTWNSGSSTTKCSLTKGYSSSKNKQQPSLSKQIKQCDYIFSQTVSFLFFLQCIPFSLLWWIPLLLLLRYSNLLRQSQSFFSLMILVRLLFGYFLFSHFQMNLSSCSCNSSLKRRIPCFCNLLKVCILFFPIFFFIILSKR